MSEVTVVRGLTSDIVDCAAPAVEKPRIATGLSTLGGLFRAEKILFNKNHSRLSLQITTHDRFVLKPQSAAANFFIDRALFLEKKMSGRGDPP